MNIYGANKYVLKKRVPKSNFHNFPPRQKEWKLQALLNLWHTDDIK